jgi:hypothetical protein
MVIEKGCELEHYSHFSCLIDDCAEEENNEE